MIALFLIGCIHQSAVTSPVEGAPADSGAVRAYNMTYARAKAAEGKPEFAAMVALLEDLPCPENTDCASDIARLKADDVALRPHVVATRTVAALADNHTDDFVAVVGGRPGWLKEGLHFVDLSSAGAERVIVFKGGLPLDPTDALGVPSEKVLVNISGDCAPEGPFPAVDARFVQDLWVAARGSEQVVLYFVDNRGESLVVSSVADMSNDTSVVTGAQAFPIYEVIGAYSHQIGGWGPGVYTRGATSGNALPRPRTYC